MNDIKLYLPNNVECCVYADDVTIYMSSNSLQEIGQQLQDSLNSLEQWSSLTGLTFSSSKTQAIHFTLKRKYENIPELYLSNQKIEYSSNVRILGMLFDRKLKWLSHIKTIKHDCMTKLNILKYLTSTQLGADRKTLMQLYFALIRPKLDYGSILYSGENNSSLKLLDTVHTTAIRIATGAFRTSPCISILAEAGEMPLL